MPQFNERPGRPLNLFDLQAKYDLSTFDFTLGGEEVDLEGMLLALRPYVHELWLDANWTWIQCPNSVPELHGRAVKVVVTGDFFKRRVLEHCYQYHPKSLAFEDHGYTFWWD